MTVLEEKRAAYYPKTAVKIKAKNTDCLFFIWQNTKGLFLIAGFYGRTQKPKLYASYPTEKLREQAAAHFAAKRKEVLDRKAADNAPHSLKVGDILCAIWGYEQTNVNFYQVTELKGKHYVILREIERQKDYAKGFNDQGSCHPVPDHFTGEPLRRKASHDGHVKVSHCQYARPYDGQPISWSSYH